MRVDAAAAALRTPGPLTVTALIWPTFAAKREQCVISRWDETAQVGWALSLGPGGVTARVGAASGTPITVATRQALPLRQWQRIWLVADPAAGTLRVGHAPLTGGGREDASAPLPPAARLDAAAPLLIGARLGPEAREHYNGKIEDPLLLAAASAAPETAAARSPAAARRPHRGLGLLAGHRWARRDRRGPPAPGRPAREPADARGDRRALDGARDVLAPRAARVRRHPLPRRRPARLRLGRRFRASPCRTDLPSGAYAHAAALRRAHATTCPSTCGRRVGRPRADVLLHRLDLHLPGLRQSRARHLPTSAYRERVAAWRRLSPQSRRPPGLRAARPTTATATAAASPTPRACGPLLTLRPELPHLQRRRAARACATTPADTHLTRLARGAGHRLRRRHRRGPARRGRGPARPLRGRADRLAPRVPHRAHARRAAGLHRDGGGRLMYLGGNGFYWRIATSPMPCRASSRCGAPRAASAPGPAEPGEYYHALDGAYGGLWRRNGRPPQLLVRRRLLGQGLFEGIVLPPPPAARDDPTRAWIFEGVKDELIGDYGLSGGGAAGFELDRARPRAGHARRRRRAGLAPRATTRASSSCPRSCCSHLHDHRRDAGRG